VQASDQPPWLDAERVARHATGLACAGDDLARAGYREPAVRERLDVAEVFDYRARDVAWFVVDRVVARTALDVAIELWLLQGEVREHELESLFRHDARAALVALGLLVRDPVRPLWRATLSLFPIGERLCLADHRLRELMTGPAPAQPVMYLGADSHLLARATPRRPVGAVLDLCTGSGVQALVAAAHAARVVGVDVSPRALAAARVSACIGSVENARFVEGDLYAPVDGERFDLILANPPFVPSPVRALTYRDGGPSGTEVLEQIVRGVAAHLMPGGLALVVAELGERRDAPIAHVVRGWLGDAPLDLHVLAVAELSARELVLGHATGEDWHSLAHSVAAWSRNLRAQGYARVRRVLLSLRPARGRAPWTRSDEMTSPSEPFGDALALRLDAITRAHDGDAVVRLRAAPGLELVETRGVGARTTIARAPLATAREISPEEERLLVALLEGRSRAALDDACARALLRDGFAHPDD
jgi:carbamoyltransferase